MLANETWKLPNRMLRRRSNNGCTCARPRLPARRSAARRSKHLAFRLKEGELGIIGSIIGRREPPVAYRTVDGGHPAPYPDMTDEQLYNYEMTFNVPRRTFDKPPRSSGQTVNEPVAPAPMQRREPSQWQQQEQTHTHARGTINAAAGATASAFAQAPGMEELHEPQPRWRQTTFRAPRYTAPPRRAQQAGEQAGTSAAAPVNSPIDFSKPVRLVTSKQPVDIITTRARHPIYKVHGYVGNDDIVTVFTLDGRLSENGPCFLENVPQTQQLHLNIYPSRDPASADRYLITQHASKEEADAAAQPGRIGCVGTQFDC
jgi:hypothetical protein